MCEESITAFSGEYRFLSNFTRCGITYEGMEYPSVEHAYQAAKTADKEARWPFTEPTMTCSAAKRHGKTLTLRPDWETLKIEIMRDLVFQKFARHANLRRALLATRDRELVEGNWWGDKFWGVCRGEGKNMLGHILMDAREVLGAYYGRPL